MKPKEKKPTTIYRIIDKQTGQAKGSYSRAYCDEFDFSSVDDARHANVHGIFKDKDKYKISRYKVTYELIEEDCDEAGAEYIEPPKEENLLEGDVSDLYPLLIRIDGKWEIKRAYDDNGIKKSGNIALTTNETGELFKALLFQSIMEANK